MAARKAKLLKVMVERGKVLLSVSKSVAEKIELHVEKLRTVKRKGSFVKLDISVTAKVMSGSSLFCTRLGGVTEQ